MPTIQPVDLTQPPSTAEKVLKKVLGQADKSEVPAAEVPATETDEALSPKFAALARQEKVMRQKMRAREEALKLREEAIKAKEAEYETAYIPKAQLKERFKSDPLGVIRENEVSYEELTQAILNEPNPELQKIYQELKAVKESQSETQKKFEEQQTKSYQDAVNQIRREAKLLVDSDAQFETIKEAGEQEAVVELIEETFKQTGQLLSIEEAAKEVETYLIEDALKKMSFKKIKERLSAKPEEKAPETSEKSLPQQMKTLTNAQSTSSKPLTAKERIERAKLAFYGKLTN